MNRMQNPFLRVRIGLVALALVLVAGTAGYQLFGFSLLDAVYQSVITVSTVGFNAPHALDAGSKVFTIILILVVAPECGSCCQSSRCWPRSGARSHGRLIAWAAVTSSSGIASCSSRDDATEAARTCREEYGPEEAPTGLPIRNRSESRILLRSPLGRREKERHIHDGCTIWTRADLTVPTVPT